MRKCLEDIRHMVTPGKHHPEVPDELRKFEAYVSDSGYCICAIPKKFKEEAEKSNTPYMFEVPVPIGYYLRNKGKFTPFGENYLIVDIEYSNTFGIIVDDDDYIY